MVNFLLYIIIDLNHIIMFVSFYSQCSTLTFYVLCKNVWWHYVVRSPIRSFRVGHLERISSDLATFARCLANSLHTLRCDHSVQLMLPAPLICAGPKTTQQTKEMVAILLFAWSRTHSIHRCVWGCVWGLSRGLLPVFTGQLLLPREKMIPWNTVTTSISPKK